MADPTASLTNEHVSEMRTALEHVSARRRWHMPRTADPSLAAHNAG